MIGIYKITNKINGKSYIGQSIQIESRWKQHINAALRGSCFHIHNAIRKYGKDNFIFDVIELTTEDLLNEREIYYISKYDTFNNGYNLTKGGDGNRGWIVNDETRRKISEAKKGKPLTDMQRKQLCRLHKSMCTPIIQCDLNGNFIKEWDSLQAAGIALNIDKSSLTKACKGKRKTCGGFIWKYK